MTQVMHVPCACMWDFINCAITHVLAIVSTLSVPSNSTDIRIYHQLKQVNYQGMFPVAMAVVCGVPTMISCPCVLLGEGNCSICEGECVITNGSSSCVCGGGLVVASDGFSCLASEGDKLLDWWAYIGMIRLQCVWSAPQQGDECHSQLSL